MLMKELKDLNKWRHVMVIDWMTQPSKDVSSSQVDIQV